MPSLVRVALLGILVCAYPLADGDAKPAFDHKPGRMQQRPESLDQT